jgi:uncharacterized damage-inducible protein DinB
MNPTFYATPLASWAGGVFAGPAVNAALDFRFFFPYCARLFLERRKTMDQKALFLKFWEKEAPATRKVIERIPQDRSDYRADPKARNAREIAWLMVREEILLARGMEQGSLTWEEIPTPPTVKEILDTYDRHHSDVTKALHRLGEELWQRDVPFMWQGQEVMRASGYDMAWGFLLDLIHHRGQLSTYLRPMGSTVPAIYGPSADESI